MNDLTHQNRRTALKMGGSALLSTMAIHKSSRAESPHEQVRVGVMGLSRGMAHIRTYANIPGVEIAYVCDVDQRRLASGARRAEEIQGRAPRAVEDVRRILDDPDVDALSIQMFGGLQLHRDGSELPPFATRKAAAPSGAHSADRAAQARKPASSKASQPETRGRAPFSIQYRPENTSSATPFTLTMPSGAIIATIGTLNAANARA